MKKISIIIPMYNAQKYIIECLDSLVKQSFKEFEIIIIDDGSTDNSYKIVEDYILNSVMEVKLIKQENKGVSCARNRGIKEASGEFLCFIDSDDIAGLKYLEFLYAAVTNQEDCDMAVCGYDRTKNVEKFFEELNLDMYCYYLDRQEILTGFLYHRVNAGICYILVKKNLLERNGIKFYEGAAYGEDTEVVWKILQNCRKVAVIENRLYMYRVHSDSAMGKFDNRRKDGYNLMIGLEEYFKQNNSEFSELFNKYGVARWVWGNLWQLALNCETYKEFKKQSEQYNSKYYIKKLITFPQRYVSASSAVFCIFEWVYYRLVRLFIIYKKEG